MNHCSTWTRPTDEEWHGTVVAKLAEINARLDREEDNILEFPGAMLELSDVLNAPDPPEPLFQHGLRRGDLGVAVSESGKGKTFGVLQIAAGLATGETLLPSFAPADRADVVFVSYEEQPHNFRSRKESIGEVFNLDDEITEAIEDGHLAFVCDPPPLFESNGRTMEPTEGFKALSRLIAVRQPDLVIIDPLSGAAALNEENGNGPMAVVAHTLARLAVEHDCAILLIHHASKERAETPSQHMARGASSLVCRARWIATLTTSSADGGDTPGALIDFTVVKDSYAALPRPVLLRRGPTGVLEEVSRRELVEAATARLAAALADTIGGNEADLSDWDIVKNAKGKAIRDALKSVFGDSDCTQAKLRVAYDMAIDQGLLIVKNARIGGVEKTIPRLAVQ